jgi:hypothetical protein
MRLKLNKYLIRFRAVDTCTEIVYDQQNIISLAAESENVRFGDACREHIFSDITRMSLYAVVGVVEGRTGSNERSGNKLYGASLQRFDNRLNA